MLPKNGKHQTLVAKVGKTEATLGVFGGKQIVAQGDSIEGMQWEKATYQDLEEVPEVVLAPNQEFKTEKEGPPISDLV